MLPKKLLILVVAYHAESTLEEVISRIPPELFDDTKWQSHILILDDASRDKTFSAGRRCRGSLANNITVLKNPKNLGYGGNQKLGYRFAIDQGFEFVVLLHGDGQYAPEEMPKLLKPLADGHCEAVFGSRMLSPGQALKGGMPFYKFCGNKVLTFLENALAGTNLSEYHSGYRLYSCKALSEIPFELNSDYFDFDTDIILQFHKAGMRIIELPVPTFYGDEICRVNGILYALKILRTCCIFVCQKWGIFYQPKFDLKQGNYHYQPKFHFISTHSLALNMALDGERILLLGAGSFELIKPFADKGCELSLVDLFVSPETRSITSRAYQANLDTFDFWTLSSAGPYHKLMALDVIEHLNSPENFLRNLRHSGIAAKGEIVISTGNIAFLPIRIMLMLGFFNYGERGILDKTHVRLFTFSSLKKLLQEQGFDIIEECGIPAPFPLAFGMNWLSLGLLKLNMLLIRFAKALFSYQIWFKVRPRPTAKQLLEEAKIYSAALESGS